MSREPQKRTNSARASIAVDAGVNAATLSVAGDWNNLGVSMNRLQCVWFFDQWSGILNVLAESVGGGRDQQGCRGHKTTTDASKERYLLPQLLPKDVNALR